MPNVRSNACAWAVPVSRMLMPTNWTSSPSSSAAPTTQGASLRHGGQPDHQTTTTTGLPRKSWTASGSPSKVVAREGDGVVAVVERRPSTARRHR